MASPWFHTLCARQRDILAFHHRNRGKPRSSDDAATLVGCDLGQGINRIPHTKRGNDGQIIAPTLLPGSIFWISSDNTKHSREVHRHLLGVEALCLQGFPILHSRCESLLPYGDGIMANLAGNAFPGTVMVSLLCALFFASTFTENAAMDDDAYTTVDCARAALALMKSSQTEDV